MLRALQARKTAQRMKKTALFATLVAGTLAALPSAGTRRNRADHRCQLRHRPRVHEAVHREGLDDHRHASAPRNAEVARRSRREVRQAAHRETRRHQRGSGARARRETRERADRRADQQRRRVQRPQELQTRRRPVRRRLEHVELRQARLQAVGDHLHGQREGATCWLPSRSIRT